MSVSESLLGWENNFEKYILDPIHGQVGITKNEKKLIDSDIFSRLRYIKQLGFVHKIYPSSTHTRFEHSIGVLHMTWSMIKRIIYNLENKGNNEILNLFDEKIITAIRFAALLHDIGHGPFSHSMEGAIKNLGLKFDHDVLSCILLTFKLPYDTQNTIESSYDTRRLPKCIRLFRREISQVISPEIREIILSIFELDYIPYRDLSKYDRIRFFLHELIKGDIGSDRIDYLLRDTYFTGLGHKFSLSEVLDNLCCIYDRKNERLLLSVNYSGKESIELLLLTRYFHYDFIANNDLNSRFEAELYHALKKYIDDKDISNENEMINVLSYISLDNDWFEKELAFEDLERVLKVNIMEFTDLIHRYMFYRIIEDKELNLVFKEKIINYIQINTVSDIEGKIYIIFNVGKPRIPILHNYRDNYIVGGVQLSTLVHDNSPFLVSLGKAYVENTNMSIFCTKDILDEVRVFLYTNQDFYKRRRFLNPIFHSIKKDKLKDRDFVLFSLYNLCHKNKNKKIIRFSKVLNEYIRLKRKLNDEYSLSPYDYCYDHSMNKTFEYSSKVFNSLILLDVCGYLNFELLYLYKKEINGKEVYTTSYEFELAEHTYINWKRQPEVFFPLEKGWKRYHGRITKLFN